MKNRFYAFLTHLILSGLVAVFTVIMVFFIWYPDPLDKATGVTEIFLMLLAIDIVIGPMMTFVVYQRGKAGLKLDLSIIATLQIAALIYGMSTVFAGRPVFIVFNQDRFDIVRPVDIDTASAKKAELAGNESAKISWLRPRWIGAVAPADRKRSEEILISALDGGADWPQLPELYVPLEQVKQQMLKRARPLSALRKLDKHNTLLEMQDNHVKWLPLRGKTQDMSVLIDSDSAEIIKVVGIDPWS
ncbi:MAG: hypothetical protein NTW85_02540 [Methylococcales bacterium]|nr:hypothetical protein [Methylococcales bacterium]